MLEFIFTHWVAFSGGGAALGALVALLRFGSPAALLAHWKAIVAAVVAFLVVAVMVGLYVELERTRVSLANEKGAFEKLNGNYQVVLQQNNVLSASNANLARAVQTQSTSIDAISAQGLQQKAAADAALAAALAKQANDRQTIDRLSARINDPKTNQGTCEDEIQSLRNSL